MRRLRISRVILLIGCIVALLAGAIFSLRLFTKKNDKEEVVVEPTPETTKEPSVTEEPIKEEKKIRFLVTGDGLLHESVYEDAKNDDGTFDFDKQLSEIAKIVKNYDLAYYNQETILGGTELGLSGYPTFNSPKEFGEYMVDSGFNLVSTANNHCLDKGETGIKNSREFWDSQSDVIMQGTNTSQEEFDEIVTGEKNGITYAFLSYCEHTNGIEAPTPYTVNYFPGHEEEMLAKVKKADEMVDVVIVAMHWGTEYSHEVNETQTYLADALTKAGADIVVGNHPHAIQPFQWVNDRPVFYAMGNLISTQLELFNQIGMIGTIDITKDEDGNIIYDNVRADLTYTATEGEYPALRYNIKTYPFSSLTNDILPDYQNVYEQYKKIITNLDSNIEIGL